MKNRSMESIENIALLYTADLWICHFAAILNAFHIKLFALASFISRFLFCQRNTKCHFCNKFANKSLIPS